MQSCTTRRLTISLCLFTLTAWSLATIAQESATPRRAGIHPSVIRLAQGKKGAFHVVLAQQWLQPATVAEKVVWAVNDVPGGDAQHGTIDSSGVYLAPKKTPKPCEVHICATVEGAANPNVWATVLLGEQQPAYEQVAKWEEPADGSIHLKNPSDMAMAPDGTIIITDAKASQVFRYNRDGSFLGAIGGGNGNIPGCFDNPRAIAVDDTGNVFVSDSRTGPPRIQVFGADGKLRYAFAQKGIGPGQVMQTRGMAFDPAGRLFAADADNMRVTIYAHDGTFIEMWQRNGSRIGDFNEPYGVIIDRNSDVFVPGYYGPCQKFTSKGELLFAFAQPDPPDGPVAFTSAATDRWGNVYLAVRNTAGLVNNSVDPEPKPARILKYNNSGDLIATIPLWNDECGENACVVDKEDRLYVLFKRSHKTGVATFEPR